MNRVLIIVASLFLYHCKKADTVKHIDYTGPMKEIEKMEIFYSENDKLKVKVLADVMYELKDGDREFPKGVYLEFYNETGGIESTLRANEAHFFKEENKWRGRGKVEIKNLEKHQQLNTEELFWKPADKKIFTDAFVTIRDQGDIIYGTGMNAKQDLTDYVIHHPSGEIEAEDE